MSAAVMPSSIRLARAPFPEREDQPLGAMDAWALGLLFRLRSARSLAVAREVRLIGQAMARRRDELSALESEALLGLLRESARQAVLRGASPMLHEALVLAAELSARTLGMRPFPTQLVGAATLLRGQLAEMQTGEGKSLTAGVAACVAASAGIPVHVVTVNDYLAERDARAIEPLMRAAGLTVAAASHGQSPDAKRQAYRSDVVYCTGKELVFDYLRDRVAAQGRVSAAQLGARQLFGSLSQTPVLRGLHFAIVDEADSIFIDEARTPLILAERAGEVDYAQQIPEALEFAHVLTAGVDFLLDERRRDLTLTRAGREHLERLTRLSSGPWRVVHVREHLALQALRAIHLFLRDRHYLIDDEGCVQIIDEYTGRVLPGRTWELGLHQMIECKESVPVTPRTQTLARITFQRFFARYLRLSGMTGTAREMARELAVVYRLQTVVIPVHRPSARRRRADVVCVDEARKWERVASEVRNRQALGQPVLVGTRSVEASERLSRCLRAHGLDHAVLNARQDAHEAAIVARAGQRGTVTVATNMAGRGTDITLGEGVEELGGLCVILTEYHESARIDRQLFGRCARQGQPGEALAIVALDDDVMMRHVPWAGRLLRAMGRPPSALVRLVRQRAQQRAERMHARIRRDTLRSDWQLERSMGFAGDPL